MFSAEGVEYFNAWESGKSRTFQVKMNLVY